ncbi:MAG: glycosyltransferase family 2 protein [Actinomycetota bacterium]
MAPDLDVVVVNYNAGEHLSKCISSLYAAAGDAVMDVVIVDNASADGSASKAVAAQPDARLIENPDNRGFAAAANQGILATGAPFVFVMNPDAEVAAGTFPSLLKFAADRPKAGAIGPLVRDPDGSIYPSARRVPGFVEAAGHALLQPFWPGNPFSRAYTMAGWDRKTEREVDWVSGSCVLLRRAALDDAGIFDDAFFMYAEDADLCTRLREAGWTVLFTPEMEVTHARGLSTAGSRRMVWEHSRSIYRYFEKHMATGGRRALLPLVWAVLWVRAAVVSRRSGRP